MLPIPTPFGIGDINAYLIDDDPLTLIDNGPNLASSFVELSRGLAARGYRVEDVGLLLLTHPHPDHVGLTRILSEQAAAAVGAIDDAATVMEMYLQHVTADDEFAARLMLRHGVDAEIVRVLETSVAPLRALGAPVAVSNRLANGETLTLRDRSLQVLRRPGHSPYDTIFHDQTRRMLFAGDHLLASMSSNALVTRTAANSFEDSRSRPLLDYRRSLKETQALDVRIVLGGHGAPITDHRSLIESRLKAQDDRCARIVDLLRPQPLSAHDLARLVWGPVAISQVFLTLSAVLGHLDLLIAEDTVIEHDHQPVVFEAI